jgi:carbon monoxide dehydrogenase subunit G
MNLLNEFTLQASRQAVWAGLTNPELAVPCMPGTELSERVGDHGFKATVTLKVGPVKLQFRGEGELRNLSADGSYGELTAKGNDSKGRGGFKADMRFTLTENGPEQCHVKVETDLSLTGSVAQYGRGVGIVKEVAGQLTSDFTKNLESKVATANTISQPSQAGETSASERLSSPSSSGSSSINLFQLLFSSVFRWVKSLLVRRP